MPRSTVCIKCWAPKIAGSPCIACGHGAGYKGLRPRRHNPEYDSAAWRRLRKRLLEDHVARFGWVCPGWRRDPHPARDLTLDHVVPLVEGGTSQASNAQILCRSCNGAKGLSALNGPAARARRATRGEAKT